MQIRIRFKSPCSGDGDLQQNFFLGLPLEKEEYREVQTQNDWGQPETSTELVVVKVATVRMDKTRVLEVLVSPHNAKVVEDMVSSGVWEYVDAHEMKIMRDALPKGAKVAGKAKTAPAPIEEVESEEDAVPEPEETSEVRRNRIKANVDIGGDLE